MEKVIKYALENALSEVMKQDFITNARRLVNTAEGKKWIKDSIAVASEISEMIADQIGIDPDGVKFLSTGGRCVIFLGEKQYDFATPYTYKKAIDNLKPGYEAA